MRGAKWLSQSIKMAGDAARVGDAPRGSHKISLAPRRIWI